MPKIDQLVDDAKTELKRAGIETEGSFFSADCRLSITSSVSDHRYLNRLVRTGEEFVFLPWRATNIVTDRKAQVSERAVFLGQAFAEAIERARKLGWML